MECERPATPGPRRRERLAEGILKKLLLVGFMALSAASAWGQTDWPTYGHDAGGARFSPLTEITPQNVKDLKVAWVYHMKPANAPDILPADRGPGGPPPGGAGARGARRLRDSRVLRAVAGRVHDPLSVTPVTTSGGALPEWGATPFVATPSFR